MVLDTPMIQILALYLHFEGEKNIHVMITMPNPSQEPPASSKAPDEDLKDMDVHCTFKIKIKSQNSGHGYIKDQ